MMRTLLLVLFLFFAVQAHASQAKDELFKINSYDMVYGKDNASIEVLEYYALTCPHCSHFYLHAFQNLKKEYIDTGKVRWIKRSYVADEPSAKATLLLGCVPKNKFENYLNILFSKQSSWAYNKDFVNILSNIASLGGMSSEQFKQCVNNHQQEKELIYIGELAKSTLKISGTPAFFINREQQQIYSEQSFKDAFEKILSLKVQK